MIRDCKIWIPNPSVVTRSKKTVTQSNQHHINILIYCNLYQPMVQFCYACSTLFVIAIRTHSQQTGFFQLPYLLFNLLCPKPNKWTHSNAQCNMAWTHFPAHVANKQSNKHIHFLRKRFFMPHLIESWNVLEF